MGTLLFEIATIDTAKQVRLPYCQLVKQCVAIPHTKGNSSQNPNMLPMWRSPARIGWHKHRLLPNGSDLSFNRLINGNGSMKITWRQRDQRAEQSRSTASFSLSSSIGQAAGVPRDLRVTCQSSSVRLLSVGPSAFPPTTLS